MDESSSYCCRRSKRKHQTPRRYGFNDVDNDNGSCGNINNNNNSSSDWEKKVVKRQKVNNTMTGRRTSTLNLLDLPKEILQHTIRNYLSTVSDRFALQTTNKAFREFSNDSKILKHLPLLPSSKNLTSVVMENENVTSTSYATTPTPTLIGIDDSVLSATTKLLPFAQQMNCDALFLLGLIATYVEDDLEVGLSLFETGAMEQDNRSRLELANLLLRNFRISAEARREGQQLLDEAIATGHGPSQLMPRDSNSSIPRSIRDQAIIQTKQEMIMIQKCVQHLIIQKKPTPPRPHWASYKCGNPLCIRICYGRNGNGVRAWLELKGYSDGWNQFRTEIIQCCCAGSSFPSRYQTPYQTLKKKWMFVPHFLQCADCRNIDYCSRTCQTLSWSDHKSTCVRQQEQQQEQ